MKTRLHAPHRHAGLAALLLALLPAACGEAPTEPTIELPLVAAHATHTGTTGRSYAMDMAQEINNVFPPGDPNGAGTALLTLNAGRRTVCWSVTARDIALPASASHIHRGPVGIAGPIVLPLIPPDATGVSTGCAEDVDRALIVDLLSNPSAYYVNVHTTEHPGGAIRAQFAR